MKIYVLNLDRRPDRMAKVASQMESLGLHFERISAIDGKEEDAQVALVAKRKFLLNQKRLPSRGEQACAASHVKIWKNFLCSGASHALILEDDVLLAPSVPAFIEDFLREPELDFLNLSANAPYSPDEEVLRAMWQRHANRPSPWMSKERAAWRQLEWRRSWRIFRLRYMASVGFVCECDPAPALASGYVVSRKAAESFIAAADDLFYPIDYVWRYARGELRQGFLARPIVTQEGGDSDIEGRSDQPKLPLRYRLLRPLVKSRRFGRRMDVRSLYGWSSL
ncbi:MULTISPECIES: glycosyltransferase family 25 protein [Brachymonas]|nr:glycosyltransferase family 25 protein [Brachymonas denitrificans]